MTEIIQKFVKIDDHNLGYEIHTNEQVITIFIDNDSNCCEEWGFLTTEDILDDFIGTNLININIVDTNYKIHPLTKDKIDYFSNGDICFVDVETSNGKLQFAIYNIHNGYYGHSVSIKSNQLNYSNIL